MKSTIELVDFFNPHSGISEGENAMQLPPPLKELADKINGCVANLKHEVAEIEKTGKSSIIADWKFRVFVLEAADDLPACIGIEIETVITYNLWRLIQFKRLP